MMCAYFLGFVVKSVEKAVRVILTFKEFDSDNYVLEKEPEI